MESIPHSMDSIFKKYGVHPPFHGKIMESIPHSMDSIWNFWNPPPLPWIPYGLSRGRVKYRHSIRFFLFTWFPVYMYLMCVPENIPLPVVRTVTMEVLRTGAYVKVSVRGFWTDLGVVSFEGYTIHRFPMRKVSPGSILLPPTLWRSWIGSPIGVVDEVNTTVLLPFFI